MDAIVHVFDPGEPGKARDFTCSIQTLTQGMRYFKEVLQKSVDSRMIPMEISVHCDVAVFEWLLGYCNGLRTREHITVESVLPLLIASNFLQMESLVGECLTFMASNLTAVAQFQQEQAGQGGDLTALPLELLSKLARFVPERKLEELASLSPAEARARYMPLVNRLYKYKLEGCLRELRTTVARCSVCQGLFSLADRAKLECPGPPQQQQHKKADGSGGRAASSASSFQTQRRPCSTAGSVHIPDAAWRLQEHLSSLRAQQIAWRGIYWHVWGLVHVLYCHTCMQHVPAARLKSCAFHPKPPVFAATAAAGHVATSAAVRQPAVGFYPCCGAAAARGADPRLAAASGCCAREHRLFPSGQAPGAPLPPGVTPELLSTLQDCTPLFTNPSALLVREASGGDAPSCSSVLGAGGAAVGFFSSDRHRAAVAAAGAAGSAVVAAVVASAGAAGIAATKSPRSRHVSFLGKESSNSSSGSMRRNCSGEFSAADADGRLVRPAASAISSSVPAPRRGDVPALGPAMAATAAALGYSISGVPGLDPGASGPGPPPPSSSPGPQSPRAQPPLGAAPAIISSPLQITGDPHVDTLRIAAAVARRLSRNGTVGNGSCGGSSNVVTVGGEGSLPHLAASPQHHGRQQLEQHVQQHYDHHQHQHSSLNQRQRPLQHDQRETEHLHGRRPALDTARSFTSLAALQLEAAQEGAAAPRSSSGSRREASRSGFPPGAPAMAAAGEDRERAVPGAQPPSLGRAVAAATVGAMSALSPSPIHIGGPGGGDGAGGSNPMAHRDRSPRHARSPPRSPHRHGFEQHSSPSCPATATGEPAATARVGASSRSLAPGAAGGAGGGTSANLFAQVLAIRSSSVGALALHLSVPQPSSSYAAVNGGAQVSTDPRDESPPRGADVAAAAAAAGVVPQRASSPPSYQRPLAHRPQHHHHTLRQSVHVHLLGGRDHVAYRSTQAERGGGITGGLARREAALPPRPSGRAQEPYAAPAAAASALQRRHSGGSLEKPEHLGGQDTDSGDGYGEEDEEPVRPGTFLRKGSGATLGGKGSGRGPRSELLWPGDGGAANVSCENNPLQRSVQAALMQQRRRLSNVQTDKHLGVHFHQQRTQPLPSQQQDPSQQQRLAHRQRIMGRRRQVGHDGAPDLSRSWAPGEGAAPSSFSAAAAAAAAAEQERRALIEQYKTQKVLSPRPRNVHMIAIAELPSGSPVGGGVTGGGDGGASGSGGVSDAQRTQPTPRAAFPFGRHETTESSPTESDGTLGGAPVGVALAAGAPSSYGTTSAVALVATSAGRAGGASVFSAAPDELNAPMLQMPPAAAEESQPSRGRKLRMELLHEDDNYRMDLLVKHLLACRPSHRAVMISRDPKPLRSRSALAPSSRTGLGRGASGGRPVSAAAALYGARQARPRSRSVSHTRTAYMPGQLSGSGQGGGYGAAGTGGGEGGSCGSRFGGSATPLNIYHGGSLDYNAQGGSLRLGGDCGIGGGGYAGKGVPHPRYSDADGGPWDKMGGTGCGASRQCHDLRPLSAPRTWRYS